jgi:hypothetical protein
MSARSPVISIMSLVMESCKCMGGGCSSIGRGVPFVSNEKLSTWNEHLDSSSLPPEIKSRSFHIDPLKVDVGRGATVSFKFQSISIMSEVRDFEAVLY